MAWHAHLRGNVLPTTILSTSSISLSICPLAAPNQLTNPRELDLRRSAPVSVAPSTGVGEPHDTVAATEPHPKNTLIIIHQI